MRKGIFVGKLIFSVSICFTIMLSSCGNNESTPADVVGETDGEVVVRMDMDGDGHISTQAGGDDCDDFDKHTYQGAMEIPDGRDNNCNEIVDEGTVLYDDDSDGFSEINGDCNDINPGIYPGAEEIEDGYDNDCDGLVDNTEPQIPGFETDDDGDGWNEIQGDCDDENPDIYPMATEIADGIDNDCDLTIDEGTTMYDDDGDGFTEDEGDCDDLDHHIYPEATELPDGLDNNCNGIIDEGTPIQDLDNDGYILFLDCDDTDPDSHPGADEVPYDGIDQNCDGMDLTDVDNDGFDAVEAGGDDCNDSDSRIFPGSHEIEVPFDGNDVDCDGKDYCTDLNCDGWPDIIFASHYSGSSYNTDSFVYFGGEGGRYSITNRIQLQVLGSLSAAAKDLNGDGYIDIVFGNYYNGSTRNINSYIYWGSASGYSTANRTELPTNGAYGVSVNDVNGDTLPDIIFSNHYDNSIYNINSFIYRGTPSGYSTLSRWQLPTNGAIGNASADLNKDGFVDVVFANYSNGSSNNINSIIYWGSSGGYMAGSNTTLPTNGAYGVLLEDLNGDGWTDIVFSNYYNGNYNINSFIYWSSSGGFSSSSRTDLPTSGATFHCASDVNGDGFIDLIFPNYYNGSNYNINSYVYLGSGSGFSPSSRIELPTNGARASDSADLNEDGYMDIVFACYYNGSSYQINSLIYWGGADGFSASRRSEIPTTGAIHVTIVGKK